MPDPPTEGTALPPEDLHPGAGPRPRRSAKVMVRVFDETGFRDRPDAVTGEEPLEIRLEGAQMRRSLAVTMRTPGNDFELVSGWLLSEGLASTPEDIAGLRYCVDRDLEEEQRLNVVTVRLRRPPPEAALDRNFLTTSACGVCGRASIEGLSLRGCLPPHLSGPVSVELVLRLPDKLAEVQAQFRSTGGLHAAALFDADGELVCAREDVGRHNALDKVVGWAALEGRLPLSDHIVMLSGRTSFELVQKSLVAGIPIVCSVSAPSSLAVDVARSFGMTLVGFLRAGRFNVYAGAERIASYPPSSARRSARSTVRSAPGSTVRRSSTT